MTEATKLLRELVEASDESVNGSDDVAAMLRYGKALDAARAHLAAQEAPQLITEIPIHQLVAERLQDPVYAAAFMRAERDSAAQEAPPAEAPRVEGSWYDDAEGYHELREYALAAPLPAARIICRACTGYVDNGRPCSVMADGKHRPRSPEPAPLPLRLNVVARNLERWNVGLRTLPPEYAATVREAAAALAQRDDRVPREPTKSMLDVGWDIYNELNTCKNIWRAMYDAAILDAAPTGIPRDDARDAARYRWLRDGLNPGNGLHRADLIYLQHLHGRALDAGIDLLRELAQIVAEIADSLEAQPDDWISEANQLRLAAAALTELDALKHDMERTYASLQGEMNGRLVAEAREREAYERIAEFVERREVPYAGIGTKHQLAAAIRALSPQTIVGQGVKDETTMKEG